MSRRRSAAVSPPRVYKYLSGTLCELHSNAAQRLWRALNHRFTNTRAHADGTFDISPSTSLLLTPDSVRNTKHRRYIAITCTLMCLTLFLYFSHFSNIQVDISHIFVSGILCYSLSLCSILTIVKIINKTYRFIYFYNTMYSKKLSSRLYSIYL